MNETEKEIKMLYEDNVQRTAPDMEKLWSRIESAVDEADRRTETSKTDEAPLRAIAASKPKRQSIGRIIGFAAAFAVIVSAGLIVFNKNAPRTANDTASSVSSADDVPTADKTESRTGNSEQETANTEYEDTKKADDNIPGEAEPNTDAIPSEEPRKTAEETEDRNDLRPVKYEDAAIGGGKLSIADYKPAGDEFFVESTVLSQTELFLDGKIVKAERRTEFCTYTVEVISCYTREGSAPGYAKGDMLTLISSSPLLLGEGKEYLLPVKQGTAYLELVFENAPQPEFAGGGRLIFHNGWKSLDKDSAECIYPENKYDRFYYDRMRIASADNIRTLIQRWQEL